MSCLIRTRGLRSGRGVEARAFAHLNTKARKIVTVEDPVECSLPGIRAGYRFTRRSG